MRIPHPEIFKAYDIRGIVGQSLTESVVEAIGRAVGSEALAAGDSAVVVGRDGRLSGPAIAGALIEGIVASGCDAVDIGVVPTPLTYFATHHLAIGSAVSVTGSHNPPDYNGLKIMLAGTTLAAERIQELRHRVEAGDLKSGAGQSRKADVVSAYLARVSEDIHLERSLKVVADCGNGVAGLVAPKLLRLIGCEVIDLFAEVDGNFPNHHPDPSQVQNLKDLIDTVQREGADLGLAFDGDGDRLGVTTARGQIIWPDRQMILFAEDILGRSPGAEIVYDVKCSRLLPAAIEQAGGKATMWKTGHSFIKGKLKESGAALGGEMSGHIFFKERWYGFDDAIYAAARLCELLSGRAQTPTEVFAAIPDTVNTPELRLEMSEGEHHQLISELIANASFPDGEICHIDGIRVDFADGFGLARASNTTPTVILRFEADTQEGLTRIMDSFRAQILALRPGLDLPF